MSSAHREEDVTKTKALSPPRGAGDITPSCAPQDASASAIAMEKAPAQVEPQAQYAGARVTWGTGSGRGRHTSALWLLPTILGCGALSIAY